MNIAYVCSNSFSINESTKSGTQIIAHDFIQSYFRNREKNQFDLTVFASGDSQLPVSIESIDYYPNSRNQVLMSTGKKMIFESILLSKAFAMQDSFDLFHINIGDGDLALPFASFVNKPIIITLYHPTDLSYAERLFSFYKDTKNIFFVSPTQWQKKRLPQLRYTATIPHGIDAHNTFIFSPLGGEQVMWAGRMVPDKGIDRVIEFGKIFAQKIALFGTYKPEYASWCEEHVTKKMMHFNNISLAVNKNRFDLVQHFQASKLFLFPLRWEEPFGLVLIESMSCGTPVIAFAKGSIPEIIQDGVTGYIINESDDDIRGDWIIKKTGIDGLIEAAERIYSMGKTDYIAMRKACRNRVERNYTIELMVKNYSEVYKKVAKSFSA